MPAMLTVPAVLAASTHAPDNVIVMVWPDLDPVLAGHVPNPVKVTAGDVGRVNVGSKVAAIVEPELSPPTRLVRNPTAKLAVANAVEGVAAKLTLVGVLAVMLTVAAVAATESELVFAVSPLYAPPTGLVTPAMVKDAGVLAGNEQVPALFASVIVTVWAEPVAVALQFAKPVGSVTVGDAGTVGNPVKTAVIVEPATSAPVDVELNPSV